ncbi:glycosyltransferase [Leptolyngbya sp. FACHB-261]|uniref:glycosyltransferase n=1 Tax=Leptolyngbya sp. FACHB-261 TaxID=2692806 RepID=UPI00168589AC|nr:glycosyltransferase [Leptolyngbya sp. FACHB-261]MBD2101127.1 glycosyltransferase [Leptolyngbya sp. FACHB-261]
MKIAFFVGEFPSLSQTFVLSQITGLIDRGHEVDIYADAAGNTVKMHPDVEKYRLLERTYYLPDVPDNGALRILYSLKLLLSNYFLDPVVASKALNVFKYGKKAASLKLLYASLPFFKRRPSYDIIQCHFGLCGVKAMLLRDIGAIQGKLVTTFHGVDISGNLRKFGNHIYDQLFDKGDFFLPISEHWRRRLVELGCNEKKIGVHHMGIDCSRFSFKPRQMHDDGCLRLVTIARLVEKKGVEYGIRAVAQLAKRGHSVEYTVVGDGDLRQDLEQLSQKLDVSHIVKLPGWKQQPEIIEILTGSDILLAPSVTSGDGDQEGIPVVLMEAMALGLPVLSTEHSGIPELVKHGHSGFLVPERDVDALVDKLELLIANADAWASMGKSGREYVEQYYDIHKLNNQLAETYEQLLAETVGMTTQNSVSKVLDPSPSSRIL